MRGVHRVRCVGMLDGAETRNADMSFWDELKRRSVFKVAVAYLAFAWLIVQVASVVLPAFDISQLALQALIVAFALGFPIALVCSWIYELTPEGIKRTDELSSEERRRMHAGRRLDFVIIGVLALALVTVIVDQYVIGDGVRYDSIAVLPFANLSGDADQEYFVDGMTDALIANLGKIAALDVISRTSAMRFKGTNLSLPEVAAALGATVVVEASARRVGGRVQIIASLVDGAADRQLWSGTFEEDFTDVLRLQNDLAREIANRIEATITPEEGVRLAASEPVNALAYEAYLRGLMHLHRLAPEELDLAERYFGQARERDPESALPYSGLALTWGARAQLNVVPATVAAPLARAHAQRAELIDEQLASVQRALATAAYLSWELADAEARVRRAIELEPSYAEAWFSLSNLRVIAGDTSEAIAQIRQAVRLDPLNPLYKMFEGVVLTCARRYDESIRAYREALEIAPNLATVWLNLTESLHLAGRFDEAIEAQREWLNWTRNTGAAGAFEAGLAESGYAQGMRNAAQVLGEQALLTGTGAALVARHYSRSGDPERVIEWWLRAAEQRNPNALMVKVAPVFDAVREDPRIQAFIESVGL